MSGAKWKNFLINSVAGEFDFVASQLGKHLKLINIAARASLLNFVFIFVQFAYTSSKAFLS